MVDVLLQESATLDLALVVDFNGGKPKGKDEQWWRMLRPRLLKGENKVSKPQGRFPCGRNLRERFLQGSQRERREILGRVIFSFIKKSEMLQG